MCDFPVPLSDGESSGIKIPAEVHNLAPPWKVMMKKCFKIQKNTAWTESVWCVRLWAKSSKNNQYLAQQSMYIWNQSNWNIQITWNCRRWQLPFRTVGLHVCNTQGEHWRLWIGGVNLIRRNWTELKEKMGDHRGYCYNVTKWREKNLLGQIAMEVQKETVDKKPIVEIANTR